MIVTGVLGVWCACVAAALLVAQGSPRRRPDLVWFLALGPFALLLMAYGVERDRAILSRPPSFEAMAAGIDVPCEALVGDQWQPARLLCFRTLDEHWQGYAAVPGTAWSTPAWYDRDHLRPV
ncbi:MAG: hypothetical protein JOZ82_10920, partial [Marmoricola sp.]|nr:hypothetical protein [Marmoricola sp.]